MKNYILLIILILLFSCKKEEKKPTNFDFILGNWLRTNDQEGAKTYEYWSKTSANLYQGLGCTLKRKDTTFKENMELKIINKQWNLIVKGVHDKPISFKITSFTNSSFIAENPENEFPKIIKYQLLDSVLLAEVIADSVKIPFRFKKFNADFSAFFKRFSKDKDFQNRHIQFPLEHNFSVFDENNETSIKEIIEPDTWQFVNFSEDKDAINKETDKFKLEYDYINNSNVIYKRVGFGNGILINYYFKKINKQWQLVKIENQSN